jgi:hypothetical protein
MEKIKSPIEDLGNNPRDDETVKNKEEQSEIAALHEQEEQELVKAASERKKMPLKKKLLVGALCAISFAVSCNISNAKAGGYYNTAENNSYYSQSVESEVNQRKLELQRYLEQIQSVDTSGLELGKPKLPIRSPVEQFGVYLDGIHFGDIQASTPNEPFSVFSKDSFEEAIQQVMEAHLQETRELVNSWGVEFRNPKIYGLKNSQGEPIVVRFDSNTLKANIIKVKDDVAILRVTNKDGTVEKITIIDGEIID